MIEEFQIFLDSLKGGRTQKIEGSFSPSFLGIDECELQFSDPVIVKGSAYVTELDLVIHLHATTIARMPCAVCNAMTSFEVTANNFYQTELLENIKGPIYDLSEPLREALLIELPRTIECNQGKCPQRENIKPFLRKDLKKDGGDSVYFPFANMDL